jgi:hypothetical protein
MAATTPTAASPSAPAFLQWRMSDDAFRMTKRVIDGLVLAVLVGFVFWQLRPDLLFANTTTAGGDTGAHVWGPAYLRDHLLPHGRLSGWTPDWYDGFPALTFYFPLPSLVIVVLGWLMPYNVAFKLVTVAGVVSLPLAAYAFGRLSGMRFPGPILLSVATLPFLFDRGFTIYGGNIPSTLAGEFAFSISLSLALVFLGVLARGLDTGRHRALAAVLLALTGLCHMIPTIFALAGAVVLFLAGPLFGERGRQRLRYVLTVLPVAGMLVAFWALPFLLRLPYTTDMGWEKITLFRKNLFPHNLPWLLALAAAGAIASVVLRKRTGLVVTGLALVCGVGFVFAPQSRLWNARVLPFWFLCLYLLAAVALAEVATALGTLMARDPNKPWRGTELAFPALALLVALIFVGLPLGVVPSWVPGVPTTADSSFIPSWVKWNYSGYERKPAYPDYRQMIDTMAKLPCGRAMWEYEPGLDRYGTPMAPMLLPYWTHGCIGSMEGLFFESASSTPYHFLNQSELSKTPSRAERDLPYRSVDVDKGVQHLQLLGVRYYMATSQETIAAASANPALRLVASSKPWEVFEVADSAQVAGLHEQPAVLKNPPKNSHDWLDVAVSQYQQDPQAWDVPIAAGGPSSWQRITSKTTPHYIGCPTAQDQNKRCRDKTAGIGTTVQQPLRIPLREAKVSKIRTTDDRISFDVDKPGSPVLVKASYFPNWQASGAKGPWRVTPNLMVVIPTARHVSLHYGYTPVDRAGWAITLLGVLLVVALARWGPLHMPEPEAEAIDEPRDQQLELDLARV